MSRHFLYAAVAALAGLVIGTVSASAHPHVWVTMRSQVIYAPDGTATGVRHAWTFDDMFTAFAVQGIDSKKRGVYTREELHPLAKTNVESLKDFDYFTVAKVNGKPVDLGDPTGDYYLDYKDEVLTLHFTIPLKTPAKTQLLEIEIFDPSYFVEFVFEEKDPVALAGAPAACKAVVAAPGQLDPALASKLSQLGPETKLDPSQFLGSQYASKIVVRCS
jgi:ABC-type uncharacterized transport system substrate-binding protein